MLANLLFFTFLFSSAHSVKWNYVISVPTFPIDLQVDVYIVDLFDTPISFISQLKNANKTVYCYSSAGTYENWRPDANNFDKSVIGNNVDGWAGEKWLDISKIVKLYNVMNARAQMAKAKGCDGMDWDNVDGYQQNTGFNLNYNKQLVYNMFLVIISKINGLKVGLKNDVEQIKDLYLYYDFAINEECYKYKECNTYTQFITNNKPVYNVEYSSSCPSSPLAGLSTILKKLSLNEKVIFC